MIYESWNPKPESLAIVQFANDIVADAAAEGVRLTLRSVYYQMVTAKVLPNTQRAYKNLSATLDRARWAGLMSMAAMEDRLRFPDEPYYIEPTTAEAFLAERISDAAEYYWTDPWRNSEVYLEVWAEKDAVDGYVQPICERFRVPYMCNRGYSSLSAMYQSAQRMDYRRTVILYVGDFDPSGMDMDRDIEDRLYRLGQAVEFRRVALLMDQIEEHNLPPDPTKLSDARARTWPYHGSWELDALPFRVLRQIVQDAITEYLPDDYGELMDEDRAIRRRIENMAEELTSDE